MSKQRLTDRLIASGISLNDLIHIVNTGDTTQNPYGSSFKGTVQQLATAIGGSSGLLVLTTSGSTGPSTYIGNNLNVPIYANSDTFVTGFTYNPTINRLTIERNQSQPDLYQTINSVSGLSFSNLTDGRVVYVGSGGLITDQSGFTYDDLTNTLGVNTIGTSGDCVNDIYVSNIHSCSPLNINPLDEGNVYFGSTSGVTIDVSNNRLGIGTPNPQYRLDVLDTNSRFFYNSTSAGGVLVVSGKTNIPRFGMLIPSYLSKPVAGVTMGLRAWNDTLYGGYGKVGDMFIRSSAESNGLNLISAAGSGTEDYIRFYAGQDATGIADLYIGGTGATRGFVGIGTVTPTEILDVNGKTKTTTLQVTSNSDINGNLTVTGNTLMGALTATTISATTYNNLPPSVFSGGTVTGPTTFTNGLTATTISATTYENLPYSGTVKGSGTSNYLPKWTGTTGLGDSQIFDNGISVGIGTSTPNAKLFVAGSVLQDYAIQAISVKVGGYSVYGYGGSNGGKFEGTDTGILGNGTICGVKGESYSDGSPIGVYGYVTEDVGGGIGEYIAGKFEVGSGPTKYSLQLIDGTEGLNKVLVSQTVDGKSNWSSDLTGLTSVSATTYYNLPIDLDTYVTGFTYGSNVFTLKQNNGQSDLTAVINSVTGWTVNGNLTVTGNTSVQGLTATTINSGTVTVTNTSGTPSQAASFDSTGKLVAGLGQTTYATYGTSTLTLSNASVGYQLIPGLTQNITVPSNCSVYVFTTGGMQNSNGTNNSFTVDVALHVDGVGPLTNGSFRRITTTNPNTVNSAWTSAIWAIGGLLNLTAGNHTIDVRAIYRNTSAGGMSGLVSSDLTLNRQGELYIMIIKN